MHALLLYSELRPTIPIGHFANTGFMREISTKHPFAIFKIQFLIWRHAPSAKSPPQRLSFTVLSAQYQKPNYAELLVLHESWSTFLWGMVRNLTMVLYFPSKEVVRHPCPRQGTHSEAKGPAVSRRIDPSPGPRGVDPASNPWLA